MFNDLLLLTAKETKVLIFNLRFPKEGKMWVVWFALINSFFNGEEKEEVKVYKDYVKPTPKILARRRKQLSKI